MPARRTGTVESFRRANGSVYYRARIWLGDESRIRVDVPVKYAHPAGGLSAEERAKLYAAAIQEREDKTGELLVQKRQRMAASKSSEAESCSAYRERLNAYRLELGRRTLRHERSAWRKWIQPRIGHLPIAKTTRDDVEGIRDALDEQIALHRRTGGNEGISGKRARNIWTVMTTTFKAAMSAKRRDLRVRTDNPCSGVLPPERTESRRRTFIYPNEMLRLLACRNVPLEWRRLYAVGCFLYLRPGELQALTAGDVDLDADVVHVTKAWDEESREVKQPKTHYGIRDVPIHPNLRPLLERLKNGKNHADALVPIMAKRSSFERARTLRTHMAKAKISRARLTENTATTMHIGFRSLRDTGITWLALAGVDVAKMQRRAGHDDISTTMGYVKVAEDIGGKLGEPFPPLPASLLDDVSKREAKTIVKNYKQRTSLMKTASPGGFERDSGTTAGVVA
jgi:integrase